MSIMEPVIYIMIPGLALGVVWAFVDWWDNWNR